MRNVPSFHDYEDNRIHRSTLLNYSTTHYGINHRFLTFLLFVHNADKGMVGYPSDHVHYSTCKAISFSFDHWVCQVIGSVRLKEELSQANRRE